MEKEAEDSCAEIAQAVKETKPEDKARKQHLMAEAVNQNCLDVIPDDWEVELDG